MLTPHHRFPRSASAYENTACTSSADDDFDDDYYPMSCSRNVGEEDGDEDEERAVEKETLEITIPRDVDQPNGMAFRMVGSRSRGIFVDYVYLDSPQTDSYSEEKDKKKKKNANLVLGGNE
ncbi:hypothetical protein CRE_08438 [Caenorhabditis remanei]|uniref:Uncharacterized protein n=1 Tax=Caenorhabditis remanei TaxID=31234 RepID=E3N006_CAERE|nr:hypothetical protein CRE_08438 [Caenorhabditis remanei]